MARVGHSKYIIPSYFLLYVLNTSLATIEALEILLILGALLSFGTKRIRLAIVVVFSLGCACTIRI